MTGPDRVSAIVPPNTWRVIGDLGDPPASYIPMSSSPRAIAVMNAAVKAIRSGQIYQIAANYLSEHHPYSPELSAYLADLEGER